MRINILEVPEFNQKLTTIKECLIKKEPADFSKSARTVQFTCQHSYSDPNLPASQPGSSTRMAALRVPVDGTRQSNENLILKTVVGDFDLSGGLPFYLPWSFSRPGFPNDICQKHLKSNILDVSHLGQGRIIGAKYIVNRSKN